MNDDTIILSTGTKISPNRTLLGINIKPDSFDKRDGGYIISEGYDNELYLTDYDSTVNDYRPVYTKNELIEIANIVINRWREFQQDVLAGKVPAKD